MSSWVDSGVIFWDGKGFLGYIGGEGISSRVLINIVEWKIKYLNNEVLLYEYIWEEVMYTFIIILRVWLFRFGLYYMYILNFSYCEKLG